MASHNVLIMTKIKIQNVLIVVKYIGWNFKKLAERVIQGTYSILSVCIYLCIHVINHCAIRL